MCRGVRVGKLTEYLYKAEFNIKKCLCSGILKNTKWARYFNSFWLYSAKNEQTISSFRGINLDDERAYFKIKSLFRNKVAMPFFDISMGTSCSLNCKLCSQWFPYLQKKELFNPDEIVDNLKIIFKYVDIVHNVAVIGGEPFLNQGIVKVLAFLDEMHKQGKLTFIRVITNGTTMPSENVLSFFKLPHFELVISHYPLEKIGNEKFIQNREELIKYLENNNCNYNMPEIHIWSDHGTPEKPHNRSPKQQKDVFSTCWFHLCRGLYNGKLYGCPRAYALVNMTNIKLRNDEVIDLKELKNKRQMKNAISKLYSIDYLNACDYCNDYKSRIEKEPAEQL